MSRYAIIHNIIPLTGDATTNATSVHNIRARLIPTMLLSSTATVLYCRDTHVIYNVNVCDFPLYTHNYGVPNALALR